MIIELIGYSANLSAKCKKCIFIEAINNSKADLILFPGSSLSSLQDFWDATKSITNRHSIIVFEVSSIDKIKTTKNDKQRNSLYPGEGYFADFRQKQVTLSKPSHQWFSTGAELVGRQNTVMPPFWKEINSVRQFQIGGKNITLLMCGETAIIASPKGQTVNPVFRFPNNQAWIQNFNTILQQTDIFVNMIHTCQGRQWIMHQRRMVLSNGARKYYFSTASLNNLNPQIKPSNNLLSKSLQYAYHNSQDITGSATAVNTFTGRYISREYVI